MKMLNFTEKCAYVSGNYNTCHYSKLLIILLKMMILVITMILQIIAKSGLWILKTEMTFTIISNDTVVDLFLTISLSIFTKFILAHMMLWNISGTKDIVIIYLSSTSYTLDPAGVWILNDKMQVTQKEQLSSFLFIFMPLRKCYFSLLIDHFKSGKVPLNECPSPSGYERLSKM